SYSYSPEYYSSSGTYAGPRQTSYQSSYYTSNAGNNQVLLHVTVPRPDDRVWVEDQLTQSSGNERMFISPPLEPGSSYTYTVRATWMENGREVSQERKIPVTPGREVTLDFTRTQGSTSLAGTDSDTRDRNGARPFRGRVVRVGDGQIIVSPADGGSERTY